MAVAFTFSFTGQICYAAQGAELVTNGDFEAGNTGFVSDYTYKTGADACGAGTYVVASGPDVGSAFCGSFGVAPNGNSTMVFAADGAANAGDVVWKNESAIPVVGGVNYHFSVDISTLLNWTTDNAPAQLVFQIGDGTTWIDLWRYDDGDNPFDPDGDGVADTSGTVSTITANLQFTNGGNFYIRLTDQQTANNGNDFTLDNISFRTDDAFSGTIVDNSAISAAPVFTEASGFSGSLSDGAYGFTYNEGAAGATVLGQVAASDTDSTSLTFSITSGNDNGWFEIDSTTGEITLSAAGVSSLANDFETATNTHTLTVQVSDGANTPSVQVVLTEANVDDTAPVVTGPDGSGGTTTGLTFAITVEENQTAVSQVSANESVNWSLGGADAAKFAIASDGTITFNEAPDYDNPSDAGDSAHNNTYVVVIRATDTAGNYTEQTMKVTVSQVYYPGEPLPTGLDADGDGSADAIESASDDRDGDGIADRDDYDPQGYFYCQADGRILTGGSVSVTGPGNVTMVKNGSETGEYQWYVDAPGTYMMAVDTSGMEFSSIAVSSAGSLTLTSQVGNPIVIGSTENGSTGYLGAHNGTPYNPASPTAYYTQFVIAEGDPNVFGNNIPFESCSPNEVTITGTTNGVEANNGTARDGEFTVSLSRASTVDTVISYAVGGSASSGSDFTALSGTVTILAGQTSAIITVPVLEDDLVEGVETVVLTLTSVSGDSATSLAGSPLASITISDDLIDQIRNQLSDILGDDLARTVDTQSRQFGKMSKSALRRLQNQDDDACGTVQPFDVDGAATLSARDAKANGSIGSETYDCSTRTRHVTTGSFALNIVEGVGTQGMASVAFMTEKMHSDIDLRGKFWGGYLSRNSARTVADGSVTGFGLNGGLYGARQFRAGLLLDYYAALAVGRHQFALTFSNTAADITADGEYRYMAAFGGLALSGEKAFERFALRPRVGIDLTYAKASAASVTATQLSLNDMGEVDVPSYQGLRGFAELVFAFGDNRDATDTFGALRSYEFAPRLLCQNAQDGVGHDCGFGASVDYLWDAKEGGRRFGVTLDYETVAESDELSIELRHETDVLGGLGKAVTAVAASSGGTPQLSHTFQLSF